MSSVRVFKMIECPSCNYIHWMGCSAMTIERLTELYREIESGERLSEKVSIDKRLWHVFIACDRCQE